MLHALSEVRAVVTGAASGLGRAVAEHLVAHGGRVMLLDLDVERAEQAVATMGEQALFQRCDVTREQDVERAIETALAEFGRITLAVNCAGVAMAQRVVGRERMLPLAELKRLLDINLSGCFLMSQAVANAMQHNEPYSADGERGVIVNTTSVAAFEGQIGQVAYSASKGGVAAMTLPLAREFAVFGVRVMAIAPSIFATPMFESMPGPVQKGLVADTPFPQRAGRPEEFAALVAHIYQNPMLNGEVIRLDGAQRMPPKSRS